MATAFFAGSFDPFTIGHKSIVDRALPLFDRVIVAIGRNTAKKPWMPLDERVAAISRIYTAEPRVSVVTYDGLTAEAARAHGATALLRGVRSVADFEAERTLADVNRNLSGLESVLLYTLPELASVSSSLVRELAAFGAPYAHLLP